MINILFVILKHSFWVQMISWYIYFVFSCFFFWQNCFYTEINCNFKIFKIKQQLSGVLPFGSFFQRNTRSCGRRFADVSCPLSSLSCFLSLKYILCVCCSCSFRRSCWRWRRGALTSHTPSTSVSVLIDYQTEIFRLSSQEKWAGETAV